MWKLGLRPRAIPFLGIHKSKFLCSVGATPGPPYLSGGHERVFDAGLARGGRTEGVARGVPVRARLYYVLNKIKGMFIENRSHLRVRNRGSESENYSKLMAQDPTPEAGYSI
jgi:hypothetical protein